MPRGQSPGRVSCGQSTAQKACNLPLGEADRTGPGDCPRDLSLSGGGEELVDRGAAAEDLLRDRVVDQLLEHRAVRLDAVRQRAAAGELAHARVQRRERAALEVELLRLLERVEESAR